MSKIDYQKLREIAEKTKIAGEAPVMPFDQRINALNDFMKHFSPDIALALLDEVKRLEDTNIDAMCRIAEVEAREIKPAKGEVLVVVSGFTGCGRHCGPCESGVGHCRGNRNCDESYWRAGSMD